MTTFTVDPATLQELSSTLSGIHSEMQTMHAVATGYEGLLGGSDLEGEVEHFCSHWGYGIGQLADHMSQGASSTWTPPPPATASRSSTISDACQVGG